MFESILSPDHFTFLFRDTHLLVRSIWFFPPPQKDKSQWSFHLSSTESIILFCLGSARPQRSWFPPSDLLLMVCPLVMRICPEGLFSSLAGALNHPLANLLCLAQREMVCSANPFFPRLPFPAGSQVESELPDIHTNKLWVTFPLHTVICCFPGS